MEYSSMNRETHTLLSISGFRPSRSCFRWIWNRNLWLPSQCRFQAKVPGVRIHSVEVSPYVFHINHEPNWPDNCCWLAYSANERLEIGNFKLVIWIRCGIQMRLTTTLYLTAQVSANSTAAFKSMNEDAPATNVCYWKELFCSELKTGMNCTFQRRP